LIFNPHTEQKIGLDAGGSDQLFHGQWQYYIASLKASAANALPVCHFYTLGQLLFSQIQAFYIAWLRA
jgi:hypothetical protein